MKKKVKRRRYNSLTLCEICYFEENKNGLNLFYFGFQAPPPKSAKKATPKAVKNGSMTKKAESDDDDSGKGQHSEFGLKLIYLQIN